MGHPVPIQPTREEARRSVVTVYCVLSFWRDRHKLAAGRFQQFARLEPALKAGRAQAHRSPGVVVFSVSGCAELDSWSAPHVLAVHGEIPQMSQAPGYLVG